jgi:hypothetical protein
MAKRELEQGDLVLYNGVVRKVVGVQREIQIVTLGATEKLKSEYAPADQLHLCDANGNLI